MVILQHWLCTATAATQVPAVTAIGEAFFFWSTMQTQSSRHVNKKTTIQTRDWIDRYRINLYLSHISGDLLFSICCSAEIWCVIPVPSHWTWLTTPTRQQQHKRTRTQTQFWTMRPFSIHTEGAGHLIVSASTLPLMSIRCRLERLPVTPRFWGFVSYTCAFVLQRCRRNKGEQYICFSHLSGAASSRATPGLTDTERLRSLHLP